jgi:hypothetical protein
VLAVFREETQYSSFLHLRAVPYGCGRLLFCQRALRRRDVSPLRRTTVLRRASCGLQLQASAAWLVRRRRGGARCLWGGDAALELALRARGAALVMAGTHPPNGRCDGKILLPFGARPWCDVRAVASNFKPAPRGFCGAGASVLAVSGEETQHSSLLRVRVVPRWLW